MSDDDANINFGKGLIFYNVFVFATQAQQSQAAFHTNKSSSFSVE